MNRPHDEKHAIRVDAWIEKTLGDLSSSQKVGVFLAALMALRKRTLKTLSDVTLGAILERALIRSQHRFHYLLALELKNGEFSLKDPHAEHKADGDQRMTAAFRFLLLEVITILENLTAGVLTQPLYEELALVSVKALTKSPP